MNQYKIIAEVERSEILNVFQLAGQCTLQIAQGDITQESLDAIVNAANAQLRHGGGVAAAIVRRGGTAIQVESDTWVQEHGPVSHAEPAYTGAGRLRCRYVIHALGPVWGDGDEDAKLTAAVAGSLRLADQLGLASIAFPAISTGIFGFPRERAAKVMMLAIRKYFKQHSELRLRLVRLTLFDQETAQAFLKAGDMGTSELVLWG